VDALALLAEDPSRAALLLDVDGTLAPIVPRPEDAHVPVATQSELRRLHSRYALVACISGRSAMDAQRVVGIPELAYVGNHGLDLDPDAPMWQDRLQAFLGDVEWPELEDKGLSVSLHYRNAPNERAARAALEAVAERARENGFVARFGRKVLEILPPLAASKGTAVERLLGERGLRRALYAGDDTTDLDAFAALDTLELAIRIAVVSAEGPPVLAEAADLVVRGPEQLLGVLTRL
jgi:trehalose 6-phosphate phosphatase